MSRSWVAAAAAVLLALAACTSSPSGDAGSPTSPATSTSPAEPAPTAEEPGARRTTDAAEVPAPPEEGDCHRLRFTQLAQASNDSDPLPCKGEHNAVTIHVGELDTVIDGHSVAVDSEQVLDQISTACPRRLAAYVGGNRSTRALSRFHVVWFTPTIEQSDAGANWFRCDLIAFAGHEQLSPLPRPKRLAGVLDDAGALDTYGLCGTTEPGAEAFQRVICSRRHAWRATSTIRIDGDTAYPGARAVRTAGDETCKDRVRQISGSSLRFRYGWEWPTKDQWRRGQHFGYCWAPD